MALRRWLSLLLVSVLFTVSPLAYSEIPDPVWLGGYFNGDETDDALVDLRSCITAPLPCGRSMRRRPSLSLRLPRHYLRGFRRSGPSRPRTHP